MKNIKSINEMLGGSSNKITVDIYKSEGRSFSINGFTEQNNSALLVWGDTATDTTEDYLIVKRKPLGIRGESDYVYCVPKSLENKSPMMGGCFAYTSDSRFSEQVCQYPIPIHDRYES